MQLIVRHALAMFDGVRGLDANLFTISVSSLQARTGCVRWCSRDGSQSVHNICILSSGTYWLCSVVFEGWKPLCSQYLYPLFRHVLVVFGGVRGMEASLCTISVSSLQANTGCVRWCSRDGSHSVHNICILSSGTYWLCSVVFEGWKPVCARYLYPLFNHVLVVFGGVRGMEAILFTISVTSLQARTGCVRWCSRVGSQSVHNICIFSSGTYWLCSVVCEGWKPVLRRMRTWTWTIPASCSNTTSTPVPHRAPEPFVQRWVWITNWQTSARFDNKWTYLGEIW